MRLTCSPGVVSWAQIANHGDPFISTAASSHESPLLAVQPQVTVPGDGAIFELDAPVIALGMWMFQLCEQLGDPSVTPPHIDGESRTQLFGNAVAMAMVGLPATVLWFETAVGIGFA